MEVIKINNEIIDADVEMIKVRLLSIVDNKLIVANYANNYMLPGGKVDAGESLIDALIREIKEETGEELLKTEIKKLVTVDDYEECYPSKNGEVKKYIRTHYYVVDKLLDINKKKELSNNEIVGNFKLMEYDIYELIKVLRNTSGNKECIFANELLSVLIYYLRKVGLIDLHTHTIYSDGELTPDELLNEAISSGIKTIAITDHDTLKGIKRVDKSKYPNIRILNGIELSVKRDHGRMHILGYNIDIDNEQLNQKLDEMRNNNIKTISALIEQLYLDFGIKFSDLDIAEILSVNNVGRPHVARLCIKYGYASTVQEAFDKYLITSYEKLGDKKKGITYEEAINLIKEAGGIPILAHPPTLEIDDKEFLVLLKDMISKGLMGLEIYHSNISDEEREKYLELVNEYNLLCSGGTDYHGATVKPDIDLGTGKNNNVLVPNSVSVLRKITR